MINDWLNRESSARLTEVLTPLQLSREGPSSLLVGSRSLKAG